MCNMNCKNCGGCVNMDAAIVEAWKNMNKEQKKEALTDYMRARGLIEHEKPASTMKTPKEWTIIDGEAFPIWENNTALEDSPVFISEGLTGKMKGVPAISTSCRFNKYCKARMKNHELICSVCFANDSLNQYKQAGEHASLNYYLLTHHIIPDNMLPVFPNLHHVRIEWAGDIENEIQAINYLNIIKKNPRVTFAWWTKNTGLLDKVLDKYGKPENMIYIQSSARFNIPDKVISKYADKLFTVYDKKYIKKHNIIINCGARSCNRCMRCYDLNNNEFYINEQKK